MLLQNEICATKNYTSNGKGQYFILNQMAARGVRVTESLLIKTKQNVYTLATNRSHHCPSNE